MTNHFGGGMQLQLHYATIGGGGMVASDTDDRDGLEIGLAVAQPGRYYLVVYTATPNPGIL